MLQLTLLGSFRLSTAAGPADIAYQRARALLAYLVLEPGAHRRDQLAAMWWPDQEATQARDSLRRMVHILRQALGQAADCLRSNRDTLAWEGRIDCDALALLADRPLCAHACNPLSRSRCIASGEAQAHAYVGPLLADIDLSHCPDFSLWLEGRRAELHRRAVALYERLIYCCETAGQDDAAQRHARRLVSLEPWSDSAVARLMGLLVAQGKYAAARAEYAALAERLLNDLGNEPGEQLQSYLASLPEPLNENETPPTAEQRPLAVLHARYLAADSNEPENHLTLLSAWAEASRARLLDLGAHVLPLHAAGLTAYFGHPQADEHAGHRAVTAALDLSSAQTAIGVHDGRGLTSPLNGEVADAGGLLAATAIALAYACPAGQVRVSASLQEQVSGWFNWASTGDTAASARPLQATTARNRLDAQTWRSAPLLGREKERAWLQKKWQIVRRGQAKTVLLTGEAGLGKSRLVGDWLADEKAPVLPLLCRPEWTFSPFRPLLEASQRWGIALPAELADGPPPLPDPQARQAQVSAWAAAFLAWRNEEAAVFWVDDAHWIDPSTLEVLHAIAESSQRQHPCLLLLAARPAHGLAWPGLDTLALGPLPDSSMLAVAEALAPELSEQRRQHAISRAEGVPLFLEALLNAAPDAQLPATLDALLASQIDQLGNARSAVEHAAIIGAGFRLPLLRAMGCTDIALMAALAHLEESGFIQPDPDQADAYRFRHGLLRDAVLVSMRRSTRQGLHLRAAEALLASEIDIARREPERLAHHYREAGHDDEAIGWLTRAVARDALRYAYREALHHGEAALALLDEQPAGPAHDAHELALRLHLGLPLVAVHGYGSAPVQATYTRAQQLAGPLPDAPEFFPLLWGLWLVSSSSSGYASSRQLAERLIHLAGLRPAAQDPFCAAHAYYALGNNLVCLGDFAAAVPVLEQAIALAPTQPIPSPYGEDAGITSAAFLSLAHWCLGDDAAAHRAAKAAIDRARRLQQPHSLAFALVFAAILGMLRDDRPAVAAHAAETMTLACEHGLALWQTAAQLFLAWEQMHSGDQQAWPVLQHCVQLARTVMAGAEGFFLAIAANACEHGNYLQGARAMALRGLEVATERQDHLHEADFLRLLGLTADNAAESRRYLGKAAAVAQQQGASAFLARLSPRQKVAEESSASNP